ncbi:MAG: ChaN family lipoprotein [Mariprofundaceae bacterium]
MVASEERQTAEEAMLEQYEAPYSLDTSQLVRLADIVGKLAEKQVIYVGEVHDQPAHHLNQLEIIKAVHERHPDIAIGMEFFQRPFQGYLDAYVKGEISEREMLKKTEYFSRWRMDYRQYRPVLRYAREHGIPLIALDVSTELRIKAGRQGLDSFTDEEKAKIPADMDRDNEAYRNYIHKAFDQFHQMPEKRFETFLQAQTLREETMAEGIVLHLRAKPERKMIVLAGFGHFIYGVGVPDRVQRRQALDAVSVIQGLPREITPDMADYVLFAKKVTLPNPGKMGIWMEDTAAGQGVRVKKVGKKSPAGKAGVKKDDLLIMVDGEPVRDVGDVKVIMLDRQVGDLMYVKVMRKGLFGTDKERVIEVTLQ